MLTINYDQIHDRLWVGSYPQQPEDVLHLKQIGVTAVMNLQSDMDLDERAVNWDLFWKFYVSQSIEIKRVPIIDFDDGELARGLPGAVTALNHLMASGYSVYLHCTAGLNRSPTVAVAWFVQYQKMSVEEALEHVLSKHACRPVTDVLTQWAAKLS